MQPLKVRDVMTENPVMIKPEQTVKSAACLMKKNECGILPVGTVAEVIGMLTDRDITIRTVAEGKDPILTPVREIMSKQVFLCQDTDSLEEAADRMRKHDVSRLLVSDGTIIIGIVTLADLLRNKGDKTASAHIMRELLYPGSKRKTA